MARANSDRVAAAVVAGEEKEEKSIVTAVMQCLPQWLPPLSLFLLHSILLGHNGLSFFFKWCQWPRVSSSSCNEKRGFKGHESRLLLDPTRIWFLS